MLEMFSQDLRYAARTLLKNAGFTLVAMLTLALGISANTVIFSVVNTVLLRSLPYPEPDRLVQIWETYAPTFPTVGVSGANFLEWQTETQSFAQIAGYRYASRGMNLTGEGEPEQLAVTHATSNLFPLLGVKAIAGRTFVEAEDKLGTAAVALISHRLWQRRFGGDPHMLRRTITLDGKSFEVIGVLPTGFNLPSWADVWLPIGLMDAELTNRINHPFSVIAKLKDEVTVAQAQTELRVRAQQLEQQYPATSRNFGVTVLPLQREITGKVEPILLTLSGAVTLVLLIACANVANLLLVRGASRQKEIALRSALGATRRHIVRQLLNESLLLALMGGAGGLLAAYVGVGLLNSLIPADLPGTRTITLDARLLGFTMGLSVLTGVLCGLLPALQTSKFNLNEALKEGAQNARTALVRHRLRGAMVVGEVSVALVLLIGAGLLIKSFLHLMRVEPGYDPTHLLTMQVSLTGDALNGGGLEGAALFQRIAERLKSLPSVIAVGGVRYLPLTSEIPQRWRFLVEGQPSVDAAGLPAAESRDVSLGYFQAMGIPLRSGRYFTERDWGQPQIIVNETMARRYWPDHDPIGKRVNITPLGTQPTWATVIGVVGDVHQIKLDGDTTMDIYWSGTWTRRFVIRTVSDPLRLVGAIREEIHRTDPNLPISEVRTMDQVLAESRSGRSFSMMLLNVFAGLALVLAMLGIYGVMAYSVAQRTGEIGIRLALGAQEGDLLSLVVRQGMSLVSMGIAIGLAGSLLLTRLMKSQLFGVSATDPLTYVLIAVMLSGVALLACYLPARKAAKVDPLVALKYQ